ncbi:MAG: hypothetical protein Ta2B_00450 [Termitinemataceae bacterium]|nr:MAG: hypothetical protein Ta2B_00450 [Termitinemataceae bacterium]
MNIESKSMKLKDLLDLKCSDMLTVNSEYQRGAVWGSTQQKKLIDSVFRGYPLPLIYLHFKKVAVAGMQRDSLEIIDGQQRINALFKFSENSFELFDPIKDDKVAKFPNFIKKAPCTWARKKYQDLSQEDKDKFDNTDIFVAKITTEIEDEARDLFIRLQAGMPLNAQEKRDAWPGGYTEFVLQYGGKPEIARYSGHDFFQKTLKAKNKTQEDRGKIRTCCAQIGMLYFEQTLNNRWPDVGTSSVDDYYYENLDFDYKSFAVQKFKNVLDKLVDIFMGYKGKQIKQAEAMHLVLFVHTLISEYVPGWEGNFIKAFDHFRLNVASDTKQKSGIFWDNFGMLISVHAASSQSVKQRHEFFSEKMLSLLNPTKKDSTRSFDDTEREIVYLKYNKKCAVCLQPIGWDDLDIHHVKEHHLGGETSIDNAAPVHRKCHPKGNDAIIFAEKWDNIKSTLGTEIDDNFIRLIKQFCLDKNEDIANIRLPEFPQKMYYTLNRDKESISISISINSISNIDIKKKIEAFDGIQIGNYSVRFDPYYNNNYGQINLIIPNSENLEIIKNNLIKFINITKSAISK